MKHWNKVIVSMLVCLMLLFSCPFALAAGTVNVEADCSLSIAYTHEQTAVPGAVFELYRLAQVDEQMNFTAVAPFENIPNDADELEESALDYLTQVRNQNVEPVHTLTTDDTGAATVSGLDTGAWLLVGQPAEREEGTYYVDPQVIILPRENEAGEYGYDVTVQPKSTRLPAGEELVERTVVKVWKDSGYENQRPQSIKVRLLRDGTVIDTVVLSAQNNWKHTWTELLPNANWTVEEEVPENYIMELQESDGVFTLTNNRKNIDQTGFIWWPVALVMGLGFLLVVVGIIVRRSGRHA